jgi:UDP-N-acetylmuramate dehydrogenase
MNHINARLPGFLSANVKVAPYTLYGVGGVCDYFAIPKNIAELKSALRFAQQKALPFFVLGSGANVLIADAGFRGMIIWMGNCCQAIKLLGRKQIYAGAGALLYDLVRFAEHQGLSGLQNLSGIPGTVGGALHMNAGAFGTEIGDLVISVEALSQTAEEKTLTNEQAGFAYRHTTGLNALIMTAATLKLKAGPKRELQEERRQILERRRSKQPLLHPSCGSVFKRPPGDYAGRLIEASELKGKRIGGAVVSEKHANFILNTGNATASDIYELIRLIQNEVAQQHKVQLQTEVQLIGFEENETP